MTVDTSGVSVASKGRFRRVRKAVVIAMRPTWRAAARHGVAAAVEHRSVPFLPGHRTVIDVGAHHGQFALLARERFPLATVVCIEPLPAALSKLGEVFAGDPHVLVEPFAASDRDGTVDMHVSTQTDSSSLLPILDRYIDAFPGTDESSTQKVNTRRLDAMVRCPVERPALLKVDAQGGELNVLRGAVHVLAAIDEIFIECSFVEFYAGQALADEIVCFLRDVGFQLGGVYSVVRDRGNRCLQADLLFRRHA